MVFEWALHDMHMQAYRPRGLETSVLYVDAFFDLRESMRTRQHPVRCSGPTPCPLGVRLPARMPCIQPPLDD